MIVRIKSPNILDNERTFLTAYYTSGTTLSVENGNGFAVNSIVVVGVPGTEKTEKCTLSSAAAMVLTMTGALSFSHPKDTPAYLSYFDQYSLEYRTSSAGSWSVVTTADLEWDQAESIYNHTAGVSTGQYRLRYYNSVTATYSDYSDVISGSGYGRTAAGYMVSEVRNLVRDKDGKIISDEQILHFLNDAQDKVSSAHDSWWFLLTEDNTTTTTASDSTYALPSDFGRMESVRFRYISTTSTSTSTTA